MKNGHGTISTLSPSSRWTTESGVTAGTYNSIPTRGVVASQGCRGVEVQEYEPNLVSLRGITEALLRLNHSSNRNNRKVHS